MNDCIVCGSSRSVPLYAGLLRCDRCHHTYADLRLSNEELFDLYSRNYFFGEEYSDYVADRRIIQKNFRLRLNSLRPLLSPNRHTRLLEIGCAYGFFLELAQPYFAHCQGIDITADGIRYARDVLHLNAVQADLLQHDFGQQQFDLVCLWDTIEHLHDPQLYIKKVSQHMESGSLIAITTGDIASLYARWRGPNWRLIHPPTHLHYFSAASLAQMLGNYGFEVVYNRYCGFYRSLDNVAYNIFTLRHKRPQVYQALKRSGLTRLDFYLNLYDILYVIARKR